MEERSFYRGDRVRLGLWTQAEVIWHDWSEDVVTVKCRTEGSTAPSEQWRFFPDLVTTAPASEVALLGRAWYSVGDLVECNTSAAPGQRNEEDAWRIGTVLYHDWASDTVLVQRSEVYSWQGPSSLVRRLPPSGPRRRIVEVLRREGWHWVSAPLFPIADLLLRRLDVALGERRAAERAVLQIVARSSCHAHEWNVQCVRAWHQFSSLVRGRRVALGQDELIEVATALLAEDLPPVPGLSCLRFVGLTDAIIALVEVFVRKPDMLVFRGIVRHLNRMSLGALAEEVRARQRTLLYHSNACAQELAGATLQRSELGRPESDLLTLREDGTFSYSCLSGPLECNWAAEGTWDIRSWGSKVRLQGLQAQREHMLSPAHASYFRFSRSVSELLDEKWTKGRKQEEHGFMSYQDGSIPCDRVSPLDLWCCVAEISDQTDADEDDYEPSEYSDYSVYSGMGDWTSDYEALDYDDYRDYEAFDYDDDHDA